LLHVSFRTIHGQVQKKYLKFKSSNSENLSNQTTVQLEDMARSEQTSPSTNSKAGSPFSRGAQHQAKRAAILSRAAKLFNTKGARSTTLADVANKLGLTKTSLYYYVRTKEDLIYQCYQSALARLHMSLDEVEAETDDSLERVLRAMERHIEISLDSLAGRGDFYAAPLEIAVLPVDHQEFLEQEYLRMFKRFRGYLRDGIEQGVIRQCHTTSTARALLTALDWSFYWLYEMPEAESKDAASKIRRLFTEGLVPRDAHFEWKNSHSGTSAHASQGFNREAQNRIKQEAFLRAGTHHFNRKGFSGTSLDDIAESLDVSKGAFYYHFANKEALLAQCYEFTLDQFERIISQVEQSDLAPIDKLGTVCSEIFELQNSDQGPLIRYNTITALPPELRRAVLLRTDDTHARLGNMMAAGISEGSIEHQSVLVTRHLLFSAINAAVGIDQWRRIDNLTSAAHDFFDVFFLGLKPR
jgi:AcrR family transcriptional regulator